MSQNVNLSVSGLYTSLNDYHGLPPGALDVGDNVESRYKNTLEPRRGFDGLTNSALSLAHFKRLTNFYVSGTDRAIGLTSDGDAVYYTGANPWPAIPGDISSGLTAPNAINAKSRFCTAGQNLYITSQDGIRSLASGSLSELIRAGVPKGLNLEAETNGDSSGFFENNSVLITTGNITSGSAIVTQLADTSGIATGQYIGGVDVSASKVVQDITYTAVAFGTAGNVVTMTYTGGGTAGSEVVTVVGNAISIQIQNAVSTATQVRTAFNLSAAATALASAAITGTGGTAQVTATVVSLAGGLDSTIPIGTTVLEITPEGDLIIETGSTTAGSSTISSLGSVVGLVAGVLVSGDGIPDGAKIVTVGASSVVLNVNAFRTGTGVEITFSTALIVTMSANSAKTATATPIYFYSGAQVGYRMVFGRVETDINGITITRSGTASAIAYATTTSPFSTNTTVMATLPKNSEEQLTFLQLYRSQQTAGGDIPPLDQYNLVFERDLVPQDFVDRVITITDETPDSAMGIPLYSGSDREGILQSNDPPPMCWDMCKFRDFNIFGNLTRPSTLSITITAVGSPSGIQNGDTITIDGSYLSTPYTETYTAASSENQATRQFKVFSAGTPSQNIADTANSLIRVINYDNDLPVHAILLSTSSDLPGQILLEADYPVLDTFEATASAHASAYDPTLTNVVSKINTINNGIAASKSGELEAVPALNLNYAGDSSSDILRVIPQRDYVTVIKTDGIYKLVGLTPTSLTCTPFDLTTKIIGADTAVSLNSAVWMLSDQGVVSISDGGVEAKSIPVDDEINRIIGSFKSEVEDVGFAIGYDSDRKYILCLPDSDDGFASIEYNYNYITDTWLTWSRNLYAAMIHSNEGKMYIACADTTNIGVSKERKNYNYTDFVDEAIDRTVISVSEDVVTLDDTTGVEVGDVLYSSSTLFSPIIAVDLAANTVTLQYAQAFVPGAIQVLQAFLCTITWKQVFGDNPAFQRQFSEGMVLFKNTRFNVATVSFVTDFSQAEDDVDIAGTSIGLYGLFPWGQVPWGGTALPSEVRFIVPQNKQLGSYIIPTLQIQQGFSDFKVQGISIAYFNVSFEVGK